MKLLRLLADLSGLFVTVLAIAWTMGYASAGICVRASRYDAATIRRSCCRRPLCRHGVLLLSRAVVCCVCLDRLQRQGVFGLPQRLLRQVRQHRWRGAEGSAVLSVPRYWQRRCDTSPEPAARDRRACVARCVFVSRYVFICSLSVWLALSGCLWLLYRLVYLTLLTTLAPPTTLALVSCRLHSLPW